MPTLSTATGGWDVLTDVAPLGRRGDVHCRPAELRRAVKDGPNGPSAASREGVLDGQEQRSYQADHARAGLRNAAQQRAYAPPQSPTDACPPARPCDLYRASEITCVQTRRAESSPTIIHGEATFPTGRTSAGPTYWPAAAGPPLPLGPSEAAIAVQATSACSAGYDANVSKWRVGKPPGCVAETTAPPGEVVVADGDSAGAVFQSVHMHRHVVACSIARVEQTSAAPGFAQMEQRLRRR